MNPGKLRHRITFLRPEEIENEIGETVIDMKPFKTVWGSIEPIKGREYLEARKIQPEVTYRIIVRYIEDITPDMMIEFKGRIFNIQSILNIGERNQYMEIYAVEKVK